MYDVNNVVFLQTRSIKKTTNSIIEVGMLKRCFVVAIGVVRDIVKKYFSIN